MMRRFVLLAAALAFGTLGASAVPAYAEESVPASSPGDPFGGQTLSPGPVFVITPGAPGDGELPPPVDPSVAEEQRQKDLEAAESPGAPTATTGPSAGASSTPGDGATTPAADPTEAAGAADDDQDESSSNAWLVAAAVVVFVLFAGIGWLAVRRRQGRGRDDVPVA